MLFSMILIGGGGRRVQAEIPLQESGTGTAGGLSTNLVSSVAAGVNNEPCTSPCTVTIPVPSSLAGNFLNVSLKWSYSGTAPAITNVYCNGDTGHSTWRWTDSGGDVSDTGDESGGADYSIAGAAAGCTSVSATFSQPLTVWTGHYVELSGIATTNAIDGVAAQASDGLPAVSAGSLTASASNDLVYATCTAVTNGIGTYNSQSIAADSGATLLEANLSFSSASEAFIQSSSGPMTPTMTFDGYAGDAGNSAICIALAIKTSPGSGSAPVGPHIVQEDLTVGEGSTLRFQFAPVNSGDALIFSGLSSQAAATQWTNISDTLGSLWTSYSAAGDPAWAIDCDANSGADLITISGVSPGVGGYVIQEISGLKDSSHTSCIDANAGLAAASGNGAPYSNAPVITPSTSGGLIEAMIQFGIGPATNATSPAGVVYAFPTYSGMTDASTMTEGGGFAYYPNSSTSAASFSWTNVNSNSWNASAIALLAAPVSPTVTLTLSENSITTAQELTVTVMVGGTPTPTGTVAVTSGSYASPATTLIDGSALIDIPAGSLGTGQDTLTATYAPDAGSAATYASSTGTNTVMVAEPAAATPSFSPAGGTYPSVQTVTISDATADATMYYTTDGSTPTASSAVYSGPLTVSSSETVQAVAMASGYAASAVASATYTINVTQPAAATPSFSPAGGTYASVQTVTISDATAGATIYYTTDGSTPTASSAVYSGPVTVSSSETVQAVAMASGYAASAVASATYTINLTQPTAATPSFSPTGGTYASVQTVTISDATAAATIYYTTDGSTPTAGSAVYSGPITVSSSETLQAVAVASGYSQSAVASAVYAIEPFASTPMVTVTPASSSITTGQSLSVAVSVNGGSGNPTPTGSVILTSGGYSAPAGLSDGSVTIDIPAGSLAIGSDTLTVDYTPDSSSSSLYTSAAGSAVVTVSQAAVPGFTLSNSGGIAITAGASTGNTSVITITPSGGFTGTIALSCNVSPAATIPPTCVVPESVAITGNGAVTAILTVNTESSSNALLVAPEGGPHLPRIGVLAFALVCFFGIPASRRKRWYLATVLAVFTFVTVVGCGGGNSGGGGGGGSGGSSRTTSGAYTVTVTGSSGSVVASTSVSLTVN